ncbi:hypothetical protein CJF12_17465 [Chryseobacterium piperi]|uniref:toll/interleukin-1 receptor domain-containing protein n=1 Tax=Chryseobacterium piperi TaxID=558152 RepID=UPI000552022D|nr:toll/interleukin-1 receptor domain-containing protein [Chryseobacterium piperi]ASW75881.1 hypothetical protein CJF12_17465 [Chryseobacterium piperi]
MNIPKVFISYSHDSIEHKKWTLELGARLRSNGIDAIIDQWDLSPGDDLPHFMETKLALADYILMICTDRYVLKANQGEGGVGYEKMIITSNLLTKINKNKIIPLIKQNGTFHVPTFLKTKLFIDFSKKDGFEFSFDELIRKIHNSPIYMKPEIGNNPFTTSLNTEIALASPEEINPKHNSDPINEIMKLLVSHYENGDNFVAKEDVKNVLNVSRIMFDLITGEGIAKKLFKLDKDGDFVITHDGKYYAIENKLI